MTEERVTQIAVRWLHPAAVAGAIALLSGCGVLRQDMPLVTPPSNGVALDGGVVAPPATSGDLLYVANKRPSDVSVLTFPQGRLVATIKQIGRVQSVCSDTSGNVWMTTFVKGSDPFHLYKFRHGGTKPVEARIIRRSAYGCAVDPTTGNLAVISYGGSSDGEVQIWRGARKGRPAVYFTGFAPAACAYDGNGDLFVDGLGGTGVALAELVKGTKNFTDVTLGKNAGWTVGSAQWDGTYVTLGAATISGSSSIYRVQISGDRGKIVDMVHLQHLASWPHFVIVNGEIAATQRGPVVRRIGLYEYPAGGKAVDVFSGFDDPLGMTVSVEPK
jgi:hypothetical protein